MKKDQQTGIKKGVPLISRPAFQDRQRQECSANRQHPGSLRDSGSVADKRTRLKNMGQGASARFEIYQDCSEEWGFRLIATNGEIIAVGAGYTTKRACLNGIDSVKRNAPAAPIRETKN